MCVCAPEELAECRAVLEEINKLFKRDLPPDERYADAGLMTDAVYWAKCWHDDKYYEWSFAADQWAGVGCAEYTLHKDKSREFTDSVFFQCDVVEHGIAACIKYYEEKHKDEVA
jgi:hypothetical protein